MEDKTTDISEKPSDSKENIPRTTTTLKMTAKYSTFDTSSDAQTQSSKNSLNKSVSAPATAPDSFLYETRYVVLGFMKHLPKDVDERTWTPVSSTPSSETSSKASAAGHRKHKALPKKKKRKSAKNFESQIREEREGFFAQAGDIPVTQTEESESSKDNRDASLKGVSFVRDDQRISDHPNSTASQKDHKNEFDNVDFVRSISISSSRDGSNITDADDELDSNSTNSSQRLDPSASGTYSSGDFADDVEIDNPSGSGTSSSESIEIDNYIAEDDSYADDESVECAAARMKKLSSTATIVPELSGVDDLPDSVGDEDPFKDFTECMPKVLSKGDLHLDLDSGSGFRSGSNITESLQEVIEETSSHLESEVNDAVSQGILTPTQHDQVALLGSPETEVARLLVSIADRVEQQYGRQLDMAVQNAFHIDLSDIPYEQFRRGITAVMDDSLSGWTQAALCLVYSRRLTFAVVQSGQRKVNYLFDYTTRLLADKAADFIINQGGWSSLAQVNIDSLTGSGDSSRVGSPTKGQGLLSNGTLEEPSAVSSLSREEQAGYRSSSENSSCSIQEPSSQDYSGVWSAFSTSALIRRAHHFGLQFSVVAAVVVVGIAVVLSKH